MIVLLESIRDRLAKSKSSTGMARGHAANDDNTEPSRLSWRRARKELHPGV